jgi:endonuclease YncB( thermonuclease family)
MPPARHVQTMHHALRSWAGIATIGLTLLLAGGDQPQAATLPKPPSPDLAGQPTYEVVSVSAANVISVRREETLTAVRLVGTYAPRGGGTASEAQAFLSRLLTGETVCLVSEPGWPTADEDGHMWAYVYRVPDGLLVNLELVRQGYARVVAEGTFEQQSLLRAYEQLAKKHEKGLWNPRSAEATEPGRTTGITKPAASQPVGAADDTIVYVTKSGKKYHRADCPHVRSGATQLSLKEARARGYTPCSHCKPPG